MVNRQEILDKLKQFLVEDTDVDVNHLDEASSLKESLGLDSVDLVGIIMRIEGTYQIRLNHIELQQVNTIGELLNLIENKIHSGNSDTPVTTDLTNSTNISSQAA